MKDYFKNGKSRETGRDEPTRFFVHIPKTAGTSFRAAAESRFGRSRVLRDYGLDSDATSDSVREEVYLKKDNSGIERAIARDNAVLVAGHVPVTKYGGQLGLSNTIVLFRDPVQQVISHYRHAVRRQSFEGGLLAFARLERSRNIQSRLMAGVDPALLGIVGLTEKYRETLAIAENRWGWKLQHKRKNASRSLSFSPFKVSNDEMTELERLNREDQMLFKRARMVFSNTWHCLERKTGTDLRAAITQADSKSGLIGWAFDMLSDRPAKIEILVNRSLWGKVVCEQPVADLFHSKLPRENHVGFTLNVEMKSGDCLEVRDIRSGRYLANHVVGELS